MSNNTKGGRETTLTQSSQHMTALTLSQYKCKGCNEGTKDCESTPNPEGQGEALPATDRETCSRGREGLVTHVVVAISARDMSVGAVIIHFSKMFINRC